MANEERIEELIKALPANLKREVEDFAEFLLKKHTTRRKKQLSLNWAGGLREYRDQYTSLELQKKALEWWGD
jgi:galactose-1-phosphate uridylyltransferase